jgi:hypothetical protein
VDANVFGGHSYRLAWLLLIPAANYLRDKWRWGGVVVLFVLRPLLLLLLRLL